MLKRRTVLIIGAGASAPFDFPIASNLSQEVAQLRAGTGLYRQLESAGYSQPKIDEFTKAFLFSGKNSIDAFLEHRTEFLQIGKAVTSVLLLPYEKEERLFNFSKNWLRQLYNSMNASFEEFGENPLTIVTFNYDRTVEHFFFTALKNSYGKSDEETKRAMVSVPIIHLHGSLGALPWQQGEHIQFGSEATPEAIKIAENAIKVIHEDIGDGRDKEFEKAIAAIRSAERVYFMGFGYNETNLRRLRIDKSIAAHVFGTSLGLGTRAKSELARVTDSKVKLIPGDCFEVIRDQVA